MTPLVRGLLLAVLVIGSLTAAADKPAADAERIAQLIKQVASNNSYQWATAAKALQRIGEPALAALRQAERADDPEVFQRFKQIRTAIENSPCPYCFFAETIPQATQLVHDNFVGEVHRGDLTAWAIRGLYQAISEKIQPDLERRLVKTKRMNEQELHDLLFDARVRLGLRPDLDDNQDCHHAIRAMLKQLDMHSDYSEDDGIRCGGRTSPGIGAELTTDDATGTLRVITPVKDGPAYKVGIRGGDCITHIIWREDQGGRPLLKPQIMPTKNLTFQEATNQLRGIAGTKVSVTVQREGLAGPLDFEVVRGDILPEVVRGYRRKADDSWDHCLDLEKGINYIRLTEFTRNSFSDFKRGLQDQDRAGFRGLILDLRFNAGGSMPIAFLINLAELFVEDGVIVTVRSGRNRNFALESEGKEHYLRFPMVCLINEETAHFGELVAACLQDHCRAVIMGERSFGEGSMYPRYTFKPTGHLLSFTTLLYYRPNGQKWDRMRLPGENGGDWGVLPNPGYQLQLPDKEQQRLRDHLDQQGVIRPRGKLPPDTGFEDRQLSMALKFLRQQIGDASPQRR